MGETRTLEPVLVIDAGASPAITWESNADDVVTVSSSGLLRAVAPGTAVVTAVVTNFPTVRTQVNVSVQLPPVVISIQPVALPLFTGSTSQLHATVQAPLGTSTQLAWSSSASAIATVSDDGLVTAMAAGSATITATSVVNPAASASIALTVADPRVTAIQMTLPPSLSAGQSATALMNVTADPGANVTLDFTSSATNVASVSAGGVVTAHAPGTAIITATSRTSPAVAAQHTLQVTGTSMDWQHTFDGRVGDATLFGTFHSAALMPDKRLIIVGANGLIVERAPNGSWARVTSPVTQSLNQVRVVGSHAFAVGDNGVILRRSASGAWVTEASGTTVNLNRIALRSDGSGLAVNLTGTVLLERSAGGDWTPHNSPIQNGVNEIGVSEQGGKYMMGSSTAVAFYRYVSNTWVPVEKIAPSQSTSTMHVLAHDDIVTSGQSPTQFTVPIYRWNSGAWSTEYTDPGPTGTSRGSTGFYRCLDGTVIAGITFNGDFLVKSGSSPFVRRNTDGNVGSLSLPVCESADRIFQVRARWVSRWDGNVLTTELLLQNLDELSWPGGNTFIATQKASTVAQRITNAVNTMLGLPAIGCCNTWLGPTLPLLADGSMLGFSAGQMGTWNGTSFTWQPTTYPSARHWVSPNGAIWLAGGGSGAQAGLMRRVGGTWSNVEEGALASTQWTVVDGVSDDVVFAGRTEMIGRWDGATLHRTPTPGFTPTAIAAFSATSAVALNSAGLRYWNGTTWSPITPTGLTGSRTAIAGRSENDFYVFNTAGDVFACTLTQCTRVKQLPAAVRVARIIGNKGLAVGDDGLVVYGMAH